DRLANERRFDIELGDNQPSVQWGFWYATNVLESSRKELTLPIASMNVARFDALSAPLDETSLASIVFARGRAVEPLAALPGAQRVSFAPQARKNAGAEARLAIAPALLRAGAFATAIDARGFEGDGDLGAARVFSMTDLAVTSQWSA